MTDVATRIRSEKRFAELNTPEKEVEVDIPTPPPDPVPDSPFNRDSGIYDSPEVSRQTEI